MSPIHRLLLRLMWGYLASASMIGTTFGATTTAIPALDCPESRVRYYSLADIATVEAWKNPGSIAQAYATWRGNEIDVTWQKSYCQTAALPVGMKIPIVSAQYGITFDKAALQQSLDPSQRRMVLKPTRKAVDNFGDTYVITVESTMQSGNYDMHQVIIPVDNLGSRWFIKLESSDNRFLELDAAPQSLLFAGKIETTDKAQVWEIRDVDPAGSFELRSAKTDRCAQVVPGKTTGSTKPNYYLTDAVCSGKDNQTFIKWNTVRFGDTYLILSRAFAPELQNVESAHATLPNDPQGRFGCIVPVFAGAITDTNPVQIGTCDSAGAGWTLIRQEE